MTLSLSSSAFPDGGSIPAQYTCEGNDVSPPLAWSGVPPGTKSLALIVDDPDAPDPAQPRMTWVHWVLYDLPPTASALPEAVATAALPPGTREGAQRLGTHRLWRTVPADRPPSLFPQALRARRGVVRT